MAKISKKIVSFNFNGYDYFSANMDDGSIRIGLKGCSALDLPHGHYMFVEAKALTQDTVEVWYDEKVSCGLIAI